MRTHLVIVSLLAFVLLHQADGAPEDISILDSIVELISNRPVHVPFIPSAAYETRLKTEAELMQFSSDRTYERQVEMILHELHITLVGTMGEKEFYTRVSVFGLPSYDDLKFYENFMLSYNQRLKQPNWALEHLTKQHFTGKESVRPSKRTRLDPDLRMHKFFRSSPYDYRAGLYDRGHLAPPCDNKAKQRWLDKVYSSTNTAPQVSNLNRDTCIWARLERYVSYLAYRSKNVYVVTGTLLKPYKNSRDLTYRVIGKNRLAVPSHFYKVILCEGEDGELAMEAFAVPNSRLIAREEGLEQARVNIEDLNKLEEVSGLKFFDLVDRSKVARPVEFQHGFKQIFARTA